jgi:hypothetical protein
MAPEDLPDPRIAPPASHRAAPGPGRSPLVCIMWLRDSPLERRARRSRVPARRDAVPDSAGALPGFQLDTPPPADQPRAKLAAPPPPDDAGPAHRYEAQGLCATFSPIARQPATIDAQYVRTRRAGAQSENAFTAPLSPPSPAVPALSVAKGTAPRSEECENSDRRTASNIRECENPDRRTAKPVRERERSDRRCV